MYKLSKSNRAIKARQQAKHLEELKRLGYIPNTLRPLKIYEFKAHKLCEDYCNGTIDEQNFDKNIATIGYKVRQLFTKDINEYGFFINQDPRGYALKLESVNNPDNVIISFRDWGSYQILSPDF